MNDNNLTEEQIKILNCFQALAVLGYNEQVVSLPLTEATEGLVASGLLEVNNNIGSLTASGLATPVPYLLQIP